MPRRKKRSRKEVEPCAYCPNLGPVTREHVPPESIFPSPRPSNLITVPCCFKCNKEGSKDDEFFKNTLVIWTSGIRTYQNPDSAKLMDSVKRSLEKLSKWKSQIAFEDRIVEIPVLTPEGLIVGSRPVYEIDLNRLERVAERIIKGLFYHHTKKRLPDDFDSLATSVFKFDSLEQIEQDPFRTKNAARGVR